MSEPKNKTDNDTSLNSSLNIKELITKLDIIFEEKLSQSFQNIMITPRQKFLNNIISSVKTFINEIYGNSIYNNDRFNNIFQSCLNNLEDKYNNYTEELEKTWEKYQNSKKIGDEETFFLSNFRKHCINTDENAIHKCQDGKFGNFIIVLKNVKNNSINNNIKINNNIIHIQYIICNKCKTSFFSNKFINYCKSCNTNYLCSTLSHNEDPNLLLATFNPPHCETLVNEKIHCMKCKDNFLYLNMKNNMLQCQNRSCNFSINANLIETICTICNKNFKTNCKIYNPIEVLQIKEAIKIILLIKKKAYPNSIPCCKDLDIKNTDFFHKKDCKGKLYIGELNQKNIIVCEKCKAINNFNKFFWTCPKCENRFKDNENSNSINKYKTFNIRRGSQPIKSIKSFCNIKNNPIQYYKEENNSNCNSRNNILTSNSANFQNNSENNNQVNKKSTLFYLINNRKNKENINNNENQKIENKLIENDYIKYKTNSHENLAKGKSVNMKRNKIENNDMETMNTSIKKKYSHSKYLRKPYDIDIIKEELEPKWIISNKKSEDKNESAKIDDKQISSSRNNIKEFNIDENVKSVRPRKTLFYNYRTHHNSNNNTINVQKENKENEPKDIIENKHTFNYYKRRKNKKYDNTNLYVNQLEKEKNNTTDKINTNNNDNNNLNKNINNDSLNNKEIPPASKYLFYKNKKNFLSQGSSVFSENVSKINKDMKRYSSKNSSSVLTTENENDKKIEKETNNSTNSNIIIKIEGNKKKRFFVSPDNIKKEEEKNEQTNRMENKYKNRNNAIKEIPINNNTVNPNQTKTLSRKKINEYFYAKRMKKKESIIESNDKKNENENENNENKNNENIQNKENIINQKHYSSRKYYQFKIKSSKENQQEEIINRNSYANYRYFNNNNNSTNNYSTNNYLKKYFSRGTVNINSLRETNVNNINSNLINKKSTNEYLNEQKNNNSLKKNNINDETIEEEKEKKERLELLNEINTQLNLKSECLDSIKIDEELSILNANKLLFKKEKNKKLNEKFSKDIKKILSETNIPNFDINDYIIRRQIGEGGSGIIYETYHKKNLNKYAIKKIIVSDINTLSDYKNEFEIVYSNPHKNILIIYGIDIQYLDENNCAIYILMEYAEEDWDTVINKRFNTNLFYTENQLISILKQLTSLLCFLQKEKKIAHRDIKPENILVFKNEIYKISDFGEAKEKISSKQLNSLRGTELYMSPLLYQGLHEEKNDVTHNVYKSDVFSLGYCMIYAASLNFNIIYEIRNVESGILLKRILNKYLGGRYSNKFIDVLLKMVIFNEDKRVDFIQLDEILRNEF